MNPTKIPENSITCLRYQNDPHWVLITKWNSGLQETYEFTHSKLISIQKQNLEPVFSDAVYEYIDVSHQTPSKLKEIYQQSKKRELRTKMFEHDLLFVLD